MKRRYGRVAKGDRWVDTVPGGHWKTTTMISAIRTTGVATAMVTEGATDALVFLGFVQHFLTNSRAIAILMSLLLPANDKWRLSDGNGLDGQQSCPQLPGDPRS
jgi:hypothetical protein